MPGCRISACGPGAQEGTAEPGSPPPPLPREPLPSPHPSPPTPTLTPTPVPSPQLPEAAGGAESQELQRWRQGPGGGVGVGAGVTGPAGGAGGGSGTASGAGGRALELAEARRRLLEVEGRRRLVSELESRVLQLHRVFLAAELRLAHRAESLSRLSGGVAQAELYGSRLKKGPRRGRRGRPPALLASALGLGSCVPWGAGRLRRGHGHGPEPDSPFRRSPPRGPASPQR
uniref:TMF-regulated nuclear protein 1 n=1 Tax=Jaculus jaculus TaxID=51337 RepID=UPI001E1B3407|nr:TMF-regulated nuclear protein 1 [Jaculus jaculus]